MNARDDFDRLLRVWLDDTARPGRPTYLDETLRGIDRIGQRPVWLSPGRWLPMQLTVPRVAMPRMVPYLILVGALLAAAVVGLAIVGSAHRSPPPFGPAANGRLAYVSQGQVWSVAPDGTDARVLTSGAPKGIPIWSRDGSRIAFLDQAALGGADATTGSPTLTVTDADGTHPITIIRDAQTLRHISWSADGRTIALSHWIDYPGQRDRIFLAASDGSSPPIQVGDPDLSAFYPAFSPDGSRIAFVSDHCQPQVCPGVGGNTYGLHVMSATGSAVREVALGAIRPDISHELSSRLVDWRSDGSRLVFAGFDANTPTSLGVYVVDVDDGRPVLRIDDARGDAYGATWSPDGDRIAFIDGDEAGRRSVVVTNADGTDRRIIAPDVGPAAPCWSPDGRAIAVLETGSGADPRIRIIPTDGRGSSITVPVLGLPSVTSDQQWIDPVGWQRLAP